MTGGASRSDSEVTENTADVRAQVAGRRGEHAVRGHARMGAGLLALDWAGGLGRVLGKKRAAGWAGFRGWAGFGFPISLVFLSFLFQTHSN